MKKQREQILLEPEQKRRLQTASDTTGIPKTEIMRQALDAWLDDDDDWNRQIAADAKSGCLEQAFADELEQIKKGMGQPL